MSQNTYTVAALASEVGVPRTTINDWLSRYENFIDTIAVGKRKVYSEATLEVLKTIANLRDSGKSSAEIEQILAQNHGVRPEVAGSCEDEKENDKSAGTPGTGAADEAAAENLPVVNGNENSANLPALQNIERSAVELASFIADLRKQQLQSIKRSRRVSMLLVVAIVVLLGAFTLIYMTVRSEFAAGKREADSMQKNMQQLNAELSLMERNRAAERAAAAREAAAMQQNMQKLNNELADMERNRAVERAAAAQKADDLQKKLTELSNQRDKEIAEFKKQIDGMNKALKQTDSKAAAELQKVKAAFETEREKLLQIQRDQQQALQAKDTSYQQKLESEAAASRQRLQEMQKKLDIITLKLEKLNAEPVPAPVQK